MKNTRRSLITSLVTLLLCSAMFVGSSFAWFTDTVSNTGNRIQAGTLKVDLLMDKGSGYESIANKEGDIFKEAATANNSLATLWEPGKTQFAKLAVENKGNLAIKYNILIDVTDEGLIGSLEYAIISSGHEVPTVDSATNWAAVKELPGVITGDVVAGRTIAAENGVLDEIVNGIQNERNYFILAVHMKETAGNEYQGKDAIIDVTVVATQVTAEKDGFGNNQYDINAQPVIPAVIVRDNVSTSAISTIQTGDIEFNTTGTAIKEASVTAGAVNNILYSEEETHPGKDVEITLNMNIDSADKNDNTVVYDISMSKTVTIKSSDVVESKSTAEVTDLGDGNIATAKVELGKGIKNVVVRHKHGSETTEMQKQSSENFTVPGYYYNENDGILTIKSQKFSDFIVSFDFDVLDVETTNALINQLEKGGVAKLSKDIGTEAEYVNFEKQFIVTIAKGTNSVLDLCGHKMYLSTSVNGETGVFRVNNGATFTIKDSVGGGAIYYKDTTDNTGGLVVCNEGTFNLYGGHIENKTTCVNSAIQGAVDVHANKWGGYTQMPTLFNMYGGELASQKDNTLRLYDSSQIAKDVNITINIYGGKITGTDAVFIQPAYISGTAHHEQDVSNEKTNKYFINIYGGEFDSINGIRVFSAIGSSKEATESNDRGISLNVQGGTFVNKIGASTKFRDAKGVAMQNNYESDQDAVSKVSSYMAMENIKSGININPGYSGN